MQTHYPEYDHIFVVSDLHLGGDNGHRLFYMDKALAHVISELRQGIGDDKRVLFVLNGDVVDFLTLESQEYLFSHTAVSKLEEIMNSEASKAVFDALAGFVRHKNNTLVILVGNHDLELSFASVQQALLDRLTESGLLAARIIFVDDGSGYRCRIGGRNVLCTHGNETDGWNKVDYGGLARIRSRIGRNLDFHDSQMLPALGTLLVIRCFNRMRKGYPLLDLIKPEEVNGYLAPAVIPDIGQDLKRFFMVIPEHVRSALWRWLGDPYSPAELHPLFLSAEMDMDCNGPNREDIQEEFNRFRQGNELPALDSEEIEPFLGRMLQIMKFFGKEKWHPKFHLMFQSVIAKLRLHSFTGSLEYWRQQAWEKLNKYDLDSPFLLDTQDDISSRAWEGDDMVCGPEIDILVAGHTHLRRCIPYTNQVYYNTGTWIPLVHLPSELVNDRDALFDFFDKLATRESLSSFRKPHTFAGVKTEALIREQGTLLRMDRVSDHGCHCRLLEADEDGNLQEVEESAWPI